MTHYTDYLLILVLLAAIALPVSAAVDPGRIAVLSVPSGAYVCIDNGECDNTPATFTVEGNAYHMVVVRQAGYRDWIDTVYVTTRMTSSVTVYMDQDPSATAVSVNVTPGGGTVCLDNMDCRANVGTTGGSGTAVFTGVSEGYHTISVESPAGYENAMKLVQVKLGNTTVVSIALSPVVTTAETVLTPIPPTGMVRVYVNRKGSTVCIDNIRCAYNLGGDPGEGTGTMVFDRIPVNGTHIVTVAAEGFEPYSATVTVERDLVSTVDVGLRPMTGVIIPATTPAATAVSSLIVTTPAAETPTPAMPVTRSGPGAGAAIGAMLLSGIIALLRKRR